MERKLIGVDLDGVLSSIALEFCKYYNQMYGENISVSDIKSYRAEEWTGRTKEEIERIFRDTPIFKTVGPIPGSKESVKLLRASGWIIHIVTYRPWYASLTDQTQYWLSEYGYTYDALHFSKVSDKSDYAKSDGIPVFI